MKKITLLLFVCIKAYAQIPFSTQVEYLDKNYVKTCINTANNKFWTINGAGNALYEVPKGKGVQAQFANSIWIGGFDQQGQLHLSANTYRQSGADFWAGPLDTADIDNFSVANNAGATFNFLYNQLWKVDCDDVNNFVAAFNSGLVTTNNYTVPVDVVNYPAYGIASFQKQLEKYYDVGNNGQYAPLTAGDYPLIKGHQQILSIYNDNYTAHTESYGLPMGLEIHERSYSYFDPDLPDSMQAVNYTTFYHYTIYNRSNTNYNNVFISTWNDVDLGYYSDDYIGTDTVNNFTYCYNGDDNDQSISGNKGYGKKPPVISHALIDTDCSNDGIDNDLDGIIDESGEHFELNRSTYYNNNIGAFPPATTNPAVAKHYYGYMSGRWKDSTAFTYGGNAYGGTIPTNFVYTGNPADNTGWTEATAGNTPGDRRIISSSGPFTFPAKSKIEWAYAVVFSQDTTQDVNTITQFNTRVRRDVRNIRYYDATHQQPQCAPAITFTPPPTGIKENENALLKAAIYPNPSHDKVSILVSENVNFADIKIMDVSGREVLRTNINENHRSVVDVSILDTGIYFVEISSGNSKMTQKLIKN